MIRTLISLVALFVISPILSYLSGLIVMVQDSSQLDTVGEIQFRGFPIWFYENASGYSIMHGWHFSRFIMNTSVWALFLLGLLLVGLFRRSKSGQAT